MATASAKNEQLNRIEGALFGNGREGLVATVARIEESVVSLKDGQETINELAKDANDAAIDAVKQSNLKFDKVADALTNLTIEVTKLTSSVDYHHKSLHLNSLLKSPKFYLAIFISFVVMHLIATYVPNLWDWIALTAGVPKLIIPLG